MGRAFLGSSHHFHGAPAFAFSYSRELSSEAGHGHDAVHLHKCVPVLDPTLLKKSFYLGFHCLIFKDVPLSISFVKVHSIYLCILWDLVNNGQPRAMTAKETGRAFGDGS